MRKVKKPVFFIVFAVIALFTLTTLFGVHSQYGDIVTTYVHGVDDIRLGIDIQGGVDVTFEPADDVDATKEQMDAALETIKLRLQTRTSATAKRIWTTRATALSSASPGRQAKRTSIRKLRSRSWAKPPS